MKNIASALIIIVFLVGLGIILYVATTLSQQSDISPEESSALYGGRVEAGFPAAGFMLHVDASGGLAFCGFSMISSTTGITAAHCFDQGIKHYAGFGTFTIDTSKLIPVADFVQLPGWDHKTSVNDLAVFKLDHAPDPSSTEVAQLGIPALGCTYRVVAYGRNELDAEVVSIERPRKSGQLCIDSIDGNILSLSGSDAGLCLGDSGSPIFEEGTGRVIGVISAIVRKDKSQPSCYIGNIGYGVRIDANAQFVAANTDADVEFVTAGQTTPEPTVSSSINPTYVAPADQVSPSKMVISKSTAVPLTIIGGILMMISGLAGIVMLRRNG